MCPVAPSSCRLSVCLAGSTRWTILSSFLFFSCIAFYREPHLSFSLPQVSFSLFFFIPACPFLGTEPGFGGPKIVGHAARYCSISSAARHIRQRAPAALVKGVWFSYVEVSRTEYGVCKSCIDTPAARWDGEDPLSYTK